ncbi:MAG: translation initiation factor IF-2, partial [Planctomycetaceae bacterium]|nr:translation initiation factor IF-2 [Planctomycetaceae bacterium]
ESFSLSIRIYALSKQLNVDSKEILDAIKQLGIEGKGSSLAGLTEEEVVLIKDRLNTQKVSRMPQSGGSTFQRPAFPAERKVVNLDIPAKPATLPTKPELVTQEPVIVEHPAKEPEPIEPPPVEIENNITLAPPETAVAPPTTTPVPPEEGNEMVAPDDIPPPEPVSEPLAMPKRKPLPTPIQPVILPKPVLPPALGRVELPAKGSKKYGKDGRDRDRDKSRQHGQSGGQPKAPPLPPKPATPLTTGFAQQGHAANVRMNPDYRGPMRKITEKIPNLDDLRQKPDGDRGGHRTVGPMVHVAPIPQGASQPRPARSKEPAAQKPDMKLPPELLRGRGNVAQTIAEHIRKHEERSRKKEEERKERDSGKKGGGVKTDSKGVRPTDSRVRTKGGTDFGGSSGIFTPDKKKRRSGTTMRRAGDDDDGGVMIPRQLKRQKVHGKSVNTAAPRKGDIVIQLPCTVKQFAENTGLSVAIVIRKLLEIGFPMTLNSQLDIESSELLAEACGVQVSVREQVTLEDRLVTALFEGEEPEESLRPRPPIVTVLGHVDHGKTTLLDYILKLNVVKGEVGGITQHIRAYRVKMPNGEDIAFLDTPGHEAFTEMRARGANCTDIVILVVAADDGVMPQTEEAISHAKAAGVPIVVALNKMDLPGVNQDRAIQEIAQQGLLPSEWGGDTEIIRCSGLTGMGVDKLLETIQVIAELNELKANPDRPAIGVALEAEMQSGQGVVCKMLVQRGTLRTGDVVLCGSSYGRVKAMYDTLDVKKQIEEATPSTPVQLVGLDVAPKAGSKFCVLDDISDARSIAEQRLAEERQGELADVQRVTLENLFQRITNTQKVQTLNIIIRADVRGSIEAIRKELGKLKHPEVQIKILQAMVGGITEADVQLADASDAIIVGFGVVPDENARVMADRKKIQIRRYDIIYNLTDDIKKALEGMLKPIEQVKELGRAMVQQVILIGRLGAIAGCRVIAGVIERDSKARVIRDSRIIGEYPLDSLKRFKDDVKEVRDGYECGIKLKGFNDLKDGDILETYKIESIARTF